MSLRRGTTPEAKLTCKRIDVDILDTIYVTFEQKDKHGCILVSLTKTNDDIRIDTENNSLYVSLTQEETLRFIDNMSISVQIRAITKSGKKIASNIARDTVYGILMDGVI